MNVKSLMSNMGTNLTRDLEPSKFVNVVMSCPVITQQFPALSNIASSVQTLLNGYETLTSKLETLRKNIETVEDTIDKTQSMVNAAQQSLTAVLDKTPGIAFRALPLEGDIVSTGGLTAFQTTIVTTNKALDDAKDNLSDLKDQLVDLESQIQKYYNQMIDKVKGYVSQIANTKVI